MLSFQADANPLILSPGRSRRVEGCQFCHSESNEGVGRRSEPPNKCEGACEES